MAVWSKVRMVLDCSNTEIKSLNLPQGMNLGLHSSVMFLYVGKGLAVA